MNELTKIQIFFRVFLGEWRSRRDRRSTAVHFQSPTTGDGNNEASGDAISIFLRAIAGHTSANNFKFLITALPDGGDKDDGVRFETGRTAFDVEKLLHSDVSAKAGLRHHKTTLT